jgi:hypothetical protein
MTVNQIKKKEWLLKDKSDCAWLVGYYDRNKLSEMEGTVPTNSIIPGAIQLNEDIENWKYFPFSNLSPESNTFPGIPIEKDFVIRTVARLNDGSYATEWRYYINSETGTVSADDFSWSVRPSISSNHESSKVKGAIQTTIALNNIASQNSLLKQMNYYSGNYADVTTQDEWNEFYAFNGTTVRDAQGRYFQVTINDTGDTDTSSVAVPSGNLFNVMSELVTLVDNNTGYLWGTPDTRSFMIRSESKQYKVNIVELQLLGTRYSFQAGIVNTLDAPWNIFAMPYNKDSNLSIIDSVNNKTLTTVDNDIYLNAIMAMQVQHPGIVYDVQLLPYCPIPGIVVDDNEIQVSDASEFSTIVTGEQNEIVGYIFHCPSSNFTTNIESVKINKAQSAISQKINNLCDKYRLSAPNYSSYFDFSVEKNNGIKWFNVDCNYKPFTPYIHINPDFEGLYGYDDNSPRGLVLGGDFSLSQIIDQWQQYQVQNKNFQAIFDRQIQNMEVNNKYQRLSDKISAGVGTLQGALSGAFLGGAWSGGTGSSQAIGGIGGAALSAIGGVADYRIKERLRNEAIDYTQDLFGYQLGNIQALPQTISKVSSLNENNKIFPVLEKYSCTFEEKVALANKIAFNGMSVGVIGNISDYAENTWTDYVITDESTEREVTVSSKNYIKGQLIRFADDGEDFHVVNSIADELNKGVYLE